MEGPHGSYGREPPEAYAWWNGFFAGAPFGAAVLGCIWFLIWLGVIG